MNNIPLPPTSQVDPSDHKECAWLRYRSRHMGHITEGVSVPLNIYEVHPDTFSRFDTEGLSLKKLGERLAPYVKHMGYTHIELLSCVNEVTMLPEPAIGSASAFMEFISELHEVGIGVLVRFYIASDILKKDACASFLLEQALCWIEMYHIDGFHVETAPEVPVRSETLPEAIRYMNTHIRRTHPDVLLITEKMDKACLPPEEGGLGFHMIWIRSWRKSLSDYLAFAGEHRNCQHRLLSEAIGQHLGESVVLPLSRSFVSGGRKSLLEKADGNYQEKIDQFKTAIMLQMTRPGKKLMFMGNEFGQVSEWGERKVIDWHLLDTPTHKEMREYVAAFNRFYLTAPALWELDDSMEGFEWIYPYESNQNMVAYKRFAKDGSDLWIALSFCRLPLKIQLPAEKGQKYEFAFETANNGTPKQPLFPRKGAMVAVGHRRKRRASVTEEDARWFVEVELPPMSGLILRPREDSHIITY